MSTSRGNSKRVRCREGLRPTALALAFICMTGLAALVSGWNPISPANAIQKALLDNALDNSPNDSAARRAAVADVVRLRARWVRITADWARLEPTEGSYDEAELARLEGLTRDLGKAGIRILLGVNGLPRWAQDRSHSGNPGTAYPIRDDALDDFGRFGALLATRFGGRVGAIECWNEPNLWTCIYPQRTTEDAYFAARVYLRMLKAFHAGVNRGNAKIRVVAGATAPVGNNDVLRTSPQRFARFLKANGAARFFDVYSHHPYTPGGSLYGAPGQPANDLSTTVTLYNLKTLLRIFPAKPFYLTEYGYNTEPSVYFGGFSVSESTQARYLRAAYRLADSHQQVKMLVWYPMRDMTLPGRPPDWGCYSGLRRVDGSRKPSWYAFARLGSQ